MQKEPHTKKKRKKKNIFLRIIIIVVIFASIIVFAFNSSVFDIKELKIDGNKQLKKEIILKNSKIKKNTNIFKIRSQQVKNNIENNPFIKSTHIKRKLPNIIQIDVIERKKTFLFKSTSIFLAVDEEGVIVEVLEKRDKKLPLIKGFSTDFVELRKNVFNNKENTNLKVFISEAEKNKILTKIDEVDKDFANEVSIQLNSGISVAFGTLDNVKYKLSLLKEILEDVEERKIKKGKIVMNKGSHPILIIDD